MVGPRGSQRDLHTEATVILLRPEENQEVHTGYSLAALHLQALPGECGDIFTSQQDGMTLWPESHTQWLQVTGADTWAHTFASYVAGMCFL
jgi:hypothetical protein